MEQLTIRLATTADQPDIQEVMNLAIRQLQAPFLNEPQILASFDIMGLDTQLIDDGTYHVVEDGNVIVGCGGWSRRVALYGGNHSGNRDASLLDPERDAARIRAMYTHPDFARRGIGRLILKTCEAAAIADSFHSAELVATLSGEPLYLASGYRLVEETHADTKSGVAIPVRLMRKGLLPPIDFARLPSLSNEPSEAKSPIKNMRTTSEMGQKSPFLGGPRKRLECSRNLRCRETDRIIACSPTAIDRRDTRSFLIMWVKNAMFSCNSVGLPSQTPSATPS